MRGTGEQAMNRKLLTLVVAPIALISSLASTSSFAAVIQVLQDYEHVTTGPGTRDDLLNTLIQANFKFDDALLIAGGTVDIPLTSINLTFSDRGLPTLPPGLVGAGAVIGGHGGRALVEDFVAVFVNGNYLGVDVADIHKGQALPRAIFGGFTMPIVNLISFVDERDGQLSLETPNAPRFDIRAIGQPIINLPNTGPTSAPAPATLTLMVLGLISLLATARRQPHS